MIEVVWVDDECLDDSGHLTHLGVSICDAAYRRGININAFRDYEAAKAELQRFPYKYMAIILLALLVVTYIIANVVNKKVFNRSI